MSEEDELQLVYVTLDQAKRADELSEILLSERLCACTNVFPGVKSSFVWEGAVQREDEWVMLVKTTAKLVPKVMERIKLWHPYECPAIFSLKPDRVEKDFARFVKQSVE